MGWIERGVLTRRKRKAFRSYKPSIILEHTGPVEEGAAAKRGFPSTEGGRYRVSSSSHRAQATPAASRGSPFGILRDVAHRRCVSETLGSDPLTLDG